MITIKGYTNVSREHELNDGKVVIETSDQPMKLLSRWASFNIKRSKDPHPNPLPKEREQESSVRFLFFLGEGEV
jgi:hypothetical protein